MLSIGKPVAVSLVIFSVGALCSARGNAQAALLMEEPYGFFGTVNPTGHNAIYFERICAETPVKLRPCRSGELGAVLSRYQGIDGYDWVAIPLVPYLYSAEKPADVPAHVDRATVDGMRNRYREAHLQMFGPKLSPGSFLRGGWSELLGAAYERRIYAFRFQTTPEQDEALMRQLNAGPNRSHFNLLFANCADFARVVLNIYFPRTFRRSIFPDAGMTTPKQIAYKLVRYARKHPETQLTVFEISQVPGYRRHSRAIKGIDESFVTTLYAVPIIVANPYLAGGLFVNYLVRGRYHLIPKHPAVLGPESLSALTAPAATLENAAITGSAADGSVSAGVAGGAQTPGAAPGSLAATEASRGAEPGLKGAEVKDE